MPRKKDFLEEYCSSSSSGDDYDEEIDIASSELNPSLHRRKRRKTGQQARDEAALGIFGSESEDEEYGKRGRGAGLSVLRGKGVGFVKSGRTEEHELMLNDDEEDKRPMLGEGSGINREGTGMRSGLEKMCPEGWDTEKKPTIGAEQTVPSHSRLNSSVSNIPSIANFHGPSTTLRADYTYPECHEDFKYKWEFDDHVLQHSAPQNFRSSISHADLKHQRDKHQNPIAKLQTALLRPPSQIAVTPPTSATTLGILGPKLEHNEYRKSGGNEGLNALGEKEVRIVESDLVEQGEVVGKTQSLGMDTDMNNGANSRESSRARISSPLESHRESRFHKPIASKMQQEDKGYFVPPLGPGFVSSIQRQRAMEPVPFDEPVTIESALTSRASYTAHEPKSSMSSKQGGLKGNSFAARMMAKMGYVEGQGLGKTGEGILNPIEVKLRPQGVGVGVVKEKTEQAKKEARRQAELRGEVLSESESEKERKARKAKKAAKQGNAAGGISRKQEKKVFRTTEEIEKNAVGLKVPAVLKSIIDMTGKEAKVLPSASGLMTSTPKLPVEEEERVKIARMARRDLESSASEWKGLQDRKDYMSMEEKRLTSDIDETVSQVRKLADVAELIKDMRSFHMETGTRPQKDIIDDLVSKLETLQIQYKDEVESYKLSEVAVASIAPIFKSSMSTWLPLSDPFLFTDYFRRLRKILKIKTKEDIELSFSTKGYISRPRKTGSYYESLLYTLWLPKVRSAINNSWDVHDPSPILNLLEAWTNLLPCFIQSSILDQLIFPKLKQAIQEWNPRLENSSSRSKRAKSIPPHIWIFPWLPFLTSSQANDLLHDVKRKFGIILDALDLSPSSNTSPSSVMNTLPNWSTLFPKNKLEGLLIRHLLPRLALLLRTELDINPADQDLSPLETVIAWSNSFKPSTIAHLLEAEFFPKWMNVLHLWLTLPGCSFEEIRQWYLFWRNDVFSSEILSSPLVIENFNKGLDMINAALDLSPSQLHLLPAPQSAFTIAVPSPLKAEEQEKEKTKGALGTKIKQKGEFAQAQNNPEQAFRDAIEDWCTQHDLLLIPLRKADEKSGKPLFRITDSAAGIGGIVCFFKGDVVWVKVGGKKTNTESGPEFEPLGLEGLLEKIQRG